MTHYAIWVQDMFTEIRLFVKTYYTGAVGVTFTLGYSVGDGVEMSRTSLQLTKNVFPAFYTELKHSGWITTHVLFEADEWRASWGSQLSDTKSD